MQKENKTGAPNDQRDFVPPYPYRHEELPGLFTLIGLARRNFLSVWTKHDFRLPFSWRVILGRQVVVCNSPSLVKEVFQTKHSVFQRKSPQMRHALEPLIGDGLFISDSETWTKRRKIVAPIIHGSRVPGFAPIMIDTINEKRDEWAGLADGQEIDALAEMAHLTAEIICRTIFGQNLGRHYAAEIVKGFSDYQLHIDQTDIISMLGWPEWLPRPRGRRIRRSVDRILSALDKIIDHYESPETETEPSVIGGLLGAREEDGSPMDREAIRNEAAVIFMAGHETTANTLA